MTIRIVTGQQAQLLSCFLETAKDDPRIGTGHISLFLGLVALWSEKSVEKPLSVFSHDVMPLCKIAGPATYHRNIKELHEFGYIRYSASYNHFQGSLVHFKPVEPDRAFKKPEQFYTSDTRKRKL